MTRKTGFYWVYFNGVPMVADYDAETGLFMLPGNEFTEDQLDDVIETPLVPPVRREVLTLAQLRKQEDLYRSVMGASFLNLSNDDRVEYLNDNGYEIVSDSHMLRLMRNGATLGEVRY